MPRYTVIKTNVNPDPDYYRPRNGPGWRILDSLAHLEPTPDPRPEWSDYDAQWGTNHASPQRKPGVSCWFARKRDAVAHCERLNASTM